ncbi:MAG: DUF3124 domain-containing protein, partial [Desulfatitalea sp.]|nr:DUF3124 domain-containing protein [Desulfatitalea sp.]NNK02747.1 DUF3124 domain-containing protein [Desulfatitalea sp.]
MWQSWIQPIAGLIFGVAAVGLVLAAPCQANGAGALSSKGHSVYVPVYSHVFTGDRAQPVYLAVTISIRNTDPDHAITITRADYYDSEGRLIKKYLTQPTTLKPLSSTGYVIKESDKVGGSGANLIVDWHADRVVNAPLIESVMISTRSALGISFTSRGLV